GVKTSPIISLVSIEEFEHTLFRTPELYFGYKFAQNRNQLGSQEGFQPSRTVTYTEPTNIELNKFYPIGNWKNHEDGMELTTLNGSIKLSFNAKEVNIVTENNAQLEIFLDGVPLTEKYSGTDIVSGNQLIVSDPGMYNIINSDTSISHIMEIQIKGKGFQAFTFTFG
ncbi:MAG: thiol-disulfide isomerase, partial [Nitrosopumilus sp.]|nr:thiol-disulfide isomerase [Nitrosopumilus sp.]